MSSSSTTACSRSPSPTPATPESSDNLEPVVNQEDLSAWCHSLSAAGFLIGDEGNFTRDNKRYEGRELELEDLLQDGAYDDSPGTAECSRALSNVSLPLGIEVADLLHNRNCIALTRPVPPPPSHPRKDPSSTSQRVVYPLKESCYNLPIMIPSIPEGGTKSRVETQVRLTVDLAHASASSGEPLRYDRVGSWKWLRLPKGTTTKKRTRKEGKVDAPPEDSLYLTAEVTCASPPHTRVTCCSSCQAREAKRVARKIAARVRPARSDSETPDEARTIPGRGKHEDTSNIVQFNCPEVLDFSTGSVILPLRITCYCRHHREKVGFLVHFTMLDHTGRIVGTGTTRPIMITDDHKSTGVNAQKSASLPSNVEPSPIPEWPSPSALDQADALGSVKRRKSAVSDRLRKRSKPYDVERTSGVLSRRGSSASLNTPSAFSSNFVTRASTPLQSLSPTSPLQLASPEQTTLGVLDGVNGSATATSLAASFDPMASLADHVMSAFDTDIVMPDSHTLDPQTISLAQLNSVFMPTSPLSPMPLSLDPNQMLKAPPQSLPFNLFSHEPPPIRSLSPPTIHRLIPSSGPTYGGIEITILGANFHSSLQLNCVFGGTLSSSTQRWSDNTLVCILPPNATPGIVPVWFDGFPQEEDGTTPCLFAYTDETDRALMELALQVVGLKMTGKIEDARNIAMRIVSTGDASEGDETSGMMGSGGMMQVAPGMSLLDLRRLLLSRAGLDGDFEKLILNFLSLLETPIDQAKNSLTSSISHPTASGQTLLHLATFLNFPSLAGFLVDHHIDIDARDRNGYTALAMAALKGHVECAKVLVQAGAALDIVTALGKTPADLAPEGFFDFMRHSGTERESSRECENDGDDEASAEEADSEDERVIKSSARDRIDRSFAHRRPATARSKSDLNPDKDHRRHGKLADSKKATEAGLSDDKQVVASFIDTFQRTIAQLQNPQGMIPSLHIPHLPNLAGMPGWGGLPQMQAVLPVLVPIPALSAIWGDRRAGGHAEDGAQHDEKANNVPAWLGMLNAQEWRASWEKWMTQANAASQSEELTDSPPAYTPRTSDTPTDSLLLDKKDPIPLSASSSADVLSTNTVVTEQLESPVMQLETSAVKQDIGQTPRASRRQSRKTHKKHDRMLVLFWIPILLFGLAWACLHFMRVAFHATKAVVTLKAGLHV